MFGKINLVMVVVSYITSMLCVANKAVNVSDLRKDAGEWSAACSETRQAVELCSRKQLCAVNKIVRAG